MLKHRVNHKFVVLVALMFSVPFFILSRHFTNANYNILEYKAVSLLSLRAKTTARLVAESLIASYPYSKTISSEKFRAAGWPARKAMLDSLKKDIPANFALFGADGKEVPAESANRKDLSKEDLFKKTMQGTSWGKVLPQKDSPPELVITEPVYDNAGKKPAGVVITRFSLVKLNDIIKTSRTSYEAGESAIIDEGGLIIADSRGLSIENPGAQVLPEIAEMKKRFLASGENGGTLKLKDSERLLVSFASIPGTKWWVYEIEPQATVYNTAQAKKARIIVFLGIIMILCFAVLTEGLAVKLLVEQKQPETPEQKQS